MQLQYLVVDHQQQIRHVSRERLEGLWCGALTPHELGVTLADELRLISVLFDEETLNPVISFFSRFEIREGAITEDSRRAAYDAMSRHQRHRYDAEEAERQLVGWPEDWQTQLAIALDTPPADLCRVGIGGPLLMADLWGMPIEQILDYFEEAREE